MRRLADAARHVGRELAAVLALMLFAVVNVWPSRAPDLRRLTARPDIAAARSAIMSWLDRNFEVIEARAPWLRPLGRGVVDGCELNWQRATIGLSPTPPRVVCTRRIWTAYGCDGDLQSRLAALSSALGAIGWGNIRGGSWDIRGGLGPSTSQMRALSWQPGGDLAHELPSPAGQSDDPSQSADMYVSWADRTDPGDYVASRIARGSDPAHASLLYQPVEVVGERAEVLAAKALLCHENTIVIELRATYYANANVNAKPDRLRKRLRVISGL